MLGKSQKSSVISSAKLSTKKYGGGSILVANFLAEFFDGLNYYINGNPKTLKILKKYISNSDKIKFINSGNNVGQILTKERFIENYSSARLFQVNSNQKIFNNLQEKKKFEHEFLKKIVSYKNIIIFDYGHGYIDTKFAAKFNKLKKNFLLIVKLIHTTLVSTYSQNIINQKYCVLMRQSLDLQFKIKKTQLNFYY